MSKPPTSDSPPLRRKKPAQSPSRKPRIGKLSGHIVMFPFGKHDPDYCPRCTPLYGACRCDISAAE